MQASLRMYWLGLRCFRFSSHVNTNRPTVMDIFWKLLSNQEEIIWFWQVACQLTPSHMKSIPLHLRHSSYRVRHTPNLPVSNSLLDQTFTDFHKGLGRIFRIIFGKSVAHTRCWRWSFPILSWRWLNLGFLYHTKRPKTAFWSRIRIINTARFPLKCSSFVQMKESSIIRCKSPKIRSDEKTHHKQNTAKLGQASVAGQDLDVSTTSGSWMKLKAINVPMPATNIPNPRAGRWRWCMILRASTNLHISKLFLILEELFEQFSMSYTYGNMEIVYESSFHSEVWQEVISSRCHWKMEIFEDIRYPCLH